MVILVHDPPKSAYLLSHSGLLTLPFPVELVCIKQTQQFFGLRIMPCRDW